VLIADDEMMIREGIRESVDWSSLQLEVVAEAEDGEEALELAMEHQAHILLVDINMPIMNGITLIKNLRKQLPDCRIIIISGHDEFVYAQEAIRLGVDDYITKPVNQKQLQEVLKKVRGELEIEEQQKSHFKMASKQIKKNFPLLRERFCRDWIEGNMTEDEVLDQLQFLQLPVSCPSMFGVIHWPEMNTNQPLMTEKDRQLILFSIENIVSEWLEDNQKILFRDQAGVIIVVLWEKVSEGLFSEMEKSIQRYLKILTNQCFKAIDGSIIEISEVYRETQAEVFNKVEVSQLVRRAEQYIYKHYHEREISLDVVAQALHVSSVYLSRMIKQDLGISFVNILTRVRIKKAIELLNSTNLTINEISERVGYDTQHYFSTAFKKMMGVSPKQYQKGGAFSNQ
jgi:two-component system response regulator YesN